MDKAIKSKEIILNSLEDTNSFARAISAIIKKDPQIILNLNGDLGSGKTTFSRFFVEELIGNTDVHSPTFTLMNVYGDDLVVYHFDFYRLESEEELEGINIEEYLPAQQGVTLIEWGDKFREILPEKRIDIDFFYKEAGRKCVVTGSAEIMEKF